MYWKIGNDPQEIWNYTSNVVKQNFDNKLCNPGTLSPNVPSQILQDTCRPGGRVEIPKPVCRTFQEAVVYWRSWKAGWQESHQSFQNGGKGIKKSSYGWKGRNFHLIIHFVLKGWKSEKKSFQNDQIGEKFNNWFQTSWKGVSKWLKRWETRDFKMVKYMSFLIFL